MTQGEEDVLKENISGLIEVTGGSVENLESEIKYLHDLESEVSTALRCSYSKVIVDKQNEQSK